jgi:ppGpp synthetase/RelA/SpoT-type nucleotidyltranferase
MPTILYKLARFPNMNLTTMQDIAGCRVILPDQTAVFRMLRRIQQNSWDVRETYDYVTNPKGDGYRAVHVVVQRDRRLVEIQLRTTWQHEWARTVESLDLIHGHGLKEGGGPEVLRRLLERSAYAVEATSQGERMSEDFDREFQKLRAQAEPFLRRT